jgi:hypothetical protein
MKESLIQTAIEEYLMYLEKQRKIIFIKNNSGAFKTEHGSFIRFGKAGSPDFLIFYKKGKCLHLEVKNETGVQDKNQKDYQKRAEKIGHEYCIVRGYDDLEECLDRLGIIKVDGE